MKIVESTPQELRIKELLNEYRSISCDENGNPVDFEYSEKIANELISLGYDL